MKKILIVAALFLAVSLIESFSQHRWVGGDVLKFDPAGYYLYLPATFIYKDLAELSFYPRVDEKYHPTGETKWYALYEQPGTNKRLNKYPLGVALGELPFFLITDLVTRLSKDYPRDGYSTPYQFAVGMSTIIWGVLGLIVLGRFLLRLFDEWAVVITVFLIAFGTNLYAYSSYELGMAHSLLFLLFSCVLSLTERWYTTGRAVFVVLLGFVLGWILVTRPVDIVVAFIPLLWPLRNSMVVGSRWGFFAQRWRQLAIAVVAFMAVVSLQLIYWKMVTGDFISYSYKGEYFDFRHPQIIDGLFSYRKGWFVYTPLALFGMLGLIVLYKRNRDFILPILLFYVSSFYLVFSWFQWYYGWGFGARPLIASLAVLSIPLCALVAYVLKRGTALKMAGLIVSVFLVALNIFQTNQYGAAIIHGTGMTREYYWRVFGRMEASEEDRKLLDSK
jgi:hypothetical protein